MRPDTPFGCLLQVERLNQESILVEIVRPSIWQLRGSPGTRGLNIKDEDYSVTACCITTSGRHGHEGIAYCLSIPTHGAEFPTTLLYLVPPSLL